MIADTFDLTGRKALVTGGSRGIGAAIVELFARHGAEVLFCHLGDHANADDLDRRLRADGLGARSTSCDVSSEIEVGSLAEWARAQCGHIDILVNCAGIGGVDQPFVNLAPADWDRMIGIHLRGTYLVTHAFFAGMIDRSWGRVINIASQLAYKGGAGLSHYCAAKAGIIGFTRALSYEGAPFDVLVNAIAPGPVETDMLMSHTSTWLDRKRAQLPVGRFGRPGEIAPTALLLASDAGRFYVGQTLSPNGGDVML